MSGLIVTGGTVVTLGESCRVIEPGSIRIDRGTITRVGRPEEVPLHDAEVVDATGKIVLPGLINAHTHLYGTLARGLPRSGPPPESFHEILERLWWRFDKLLDEEAIVRNAQVGMLEALRCGVTTLIDHHSSPNAIPGSLDRIADTALEIGIRLATAYEVSDRDGSDVRDLGVQENIRFARRIRDEKPPLLGAAVGAHASFTLSDETLARLAATREETGAPIHLHMDEGTEDRAAAQAQSFRSTARRLADRGILREGTILAHAVNMEITDIALLAERKVFVTHQPLSNGANAVGRAQVPAFLSGGVTVCLGTDGMSGSLGAEALTAGAVHRMAERDMSIPFDLPCRLAWSGNTRLAATLFDPPPGQLREGSAGDLVVIRYQPPTRIDERNVAAHWMLGMLHAPVEEVFVAGELVYRNGCYPRVDAEGMIRSSRECADRLWRRF